MRSRLLGCVVIVASVSMGCGGSDFAGFDGQGVPADAASEGGTGGAGIGGTGGTGTGGTGGSGVGGQGGSGTGGAAGQGGTGGEAGHATGGAAGQGGAGGAAGQGGAGGAAGQGGAGGEAGQGGIAGAAGTGGTAGQAGAAGAAGGDAGVDAEAGADADAGDAADGEAGCISTGAEVCDGLDNDCNGLVDDGLSAIACYDGPVGTMGVGACHQGVASCVGGVLTTCVGDVTPAPEACNGLDDDCDDTIDDSVAPEICYSGPAGTMGVGACHAGTSTCSGGVMGPCVGEALPASESCDGIDNDCNAAVDDNVAPVSCYSGPSGTDGTGVCHGGTRSCVNGTLGVCTGEVVPSTEVCDGLDNDCDGLVDDGNPGGGLACQTGQPGVCAQGSTACVGGAISCVQSVMPTPETCDGLDNDCDGVVDDGNPGGGQGCQTGLAGVCAAGTTACAGGVLVCNQNVQPGPETCDGLDNNCDGAVDEGNPGGGAACGGTAVGQCRAITACRNGTLACVGTFVGPTPVGAATNPGTRTSPVSTIQQGIANAKLIGGGADVCVCDDTSVAGPSTFAEDVTMAEGVSVLGGYACTNWNRAITTNITRIQDTTRTGVKFPAGITSVTSLDGMTVLGQAQNTGTSAAITVTDASPTLQDLTVSGGAAPTTFGLSVVATASASASPTINNGSYYATATNGGTQIFVQLDQAAAKLTNVNMTPGPVVVSAVAVSVGLRCIGCRGTSITGGTIDAGFASTTVAGLWASGAVAGLVVSGTAINGGKAQGGSNPVARGVHLDSCSGAPAFSAASILGGWGNSASRIIGLDVSGSACAPTVTGGAIRGCESGGACTGLQSTGAPVVVTSVPNIVGATSGATNATYGARCLSGGCAAITGSTISAGFINGAQTAMGIDIEQSATKVDTNQIRGPMCNSASNTGAYYAAYLRAGPALVNNVLRDGVCSAPQDVLRFEKVSVGPIMTWPIVVNNTIEYTTCTGCGARRGISLISPMGMAGRAGRFHNNIVRNTAAGGTSWPVYEWDNDATPESFLNNDLWDGTAAGLYFFKGGNLTTIGAVNTTVPGAAANISGAPLLDATWHIAADSACRNAGTASDAPDHDFDGDKRPTESSVDIGADEYQP